MERSVILKHLEEAERHVGDGERLVAEQKSWRHVMADVAVLGTVQGTAETANSRLGATVK